MKGHVSSFFMTMIMALPLAAIPLMSIFGIPQFGSLASTFHEETGFLPEDPNANSEWDSAPAFGTEQTATAPRFSSDSMVKPVSNSMPENHFSSSTDAAFSTANNGSTVWEQSLQQLAQYGIQDYRLQPGLEAGTSHFACFLRRQANGQSGSTVIRFEAEAANRELAIQKTLQQIVRWQGRR